MTRLRYLLAVLLVGLAGHAHAQATKVLKDANGAPFAILGHIDTSGNFYPQISVCDPATAANCQTVSGGAAYVSIQNTPTVNLGTTAGVATAANQAAVLGPVSPGAAPANTVLMGCNYVVGGISLSTTQAAAVGCDQTGNMKVDVAMVTGIAAGAAATGYTGSGVMGVTASGAAGYTPGQFEFLQMNLDGNLAADVMQNIGNVPTQQHQCGSHAFVNTTTAADTQVIAPVAGKNVYVCDVDFSVGATANAFYVESATAASCGGTLAALDVTWTMPAYGAKSASDPYFRGLTAGVGNGVCVHTTAAAPTSLGIYYDQY